MERLGGEYVGAEVSPKKVALASSIGATIEWYDFFIYGTAAGLVFPALFFTNLSPVVGGIVAFATFAVGFLARPVGSVIFGHYGDRIGRKTMLILTLLIMGVSTFAIGLLPTYGQIGGWAAVLLVTMRVFQGIAVGGEYGGAVLMAVEYAPEGRRGFFGSWPQVGAPAGLLLASAAFGLLSLLPEEAFLTWGWRVAFWRASCWSLWDCISGCKSSRPRLSDGLERRRRRRASRSWRCCVPSRKSWCSAWA